MIDPTSSVSIDFVTRDHRIWDYDGGALQVSIDGNRLNKSVHEDEWRSEAKWLEYAGNYLFGDLYEILETTNAILSKREIYDDNRIYFEGYDNHLILEYLGGEALRVAYRVKPDRETDDDGFTHRPISASACGYPVKIDAWGKAVQQAVEEFQEELRDNGDIEYADWFDDELAKLKANLS